MATFDYNRTNLGAATLSSPITAAATTATVGASDAATFPTAPFYATIMPVGETPNQLNSEIVQVTANNSGVLGLVRAQRGTTAKTFDAGAPVMNGVYIQDLEQAQAVGKSFFSATLTSGVYYINDSRVPTTPADGDSIRVVFGSDWTSGTPQLSLNNGTAKNIYAGNNLTSGNASTTTNAMVKSGVIYELTYYNGNWYVLNLVANNSITSDSMDWTTMTVGSERVVGYLGSTNQPIYEQKFSGTISVTAPTVSSAINIISGVSNLLNAYGYVQRSGIQFPLPYVNTTVFTATPVTFDEFCRVYRDASGTVILNLLSLSTKTYDYVVVLRYTKPN